MYTCTCACFPRAPFVCPSSKLFHRVWLFQSACDRARRMEARLLGTGVWVYARMRLERDDSDRHVAVFAPAMPLVYDQQVTRRSWCKDLLQTPPLLSLSSHPSAFRDLSSPSFSPISIPFHFGLGFIFILRSIPPMRLCAIRGLSLAYFPSIFHPFRFGLGLVFIRESFLP